MLTQELALARKVNIKWRKFQFADRNAFENRWDDELAAKKRAAWDAFIAATNLEGVSDDENGESFTVSLDGSYHIFFYRMKGDPRYAGTYLAD